MKLINLIVELLIIDSMIRDPDFKATQGAIGERLGLTNRTIRDRFEILKNLGAPLAIVGTWSNGFVYTEEWDFWVGLRQTVENYLEDCK